MLVNSYSVEREISGSISSVGSTLRILKYLRNIGTPFALHCPTLQWHHDDYLSSPVSGRRNKKTKAACKQTQQLLTLLAQQCWELLRACWQWCANGRNNSQHCCANNVGSCCVCVGSGVQTDATTLNNVGTCSASWEGYNP